MTREAEKANPDARDKAMSNGGLKAVLDWSQQLKSTLTEITTGSTSAYWKPCTLDTGHRETFQTEIVSFWIDRFLGFFHTPPVIPRSISRKDLLDLGREAEVCNKS